MRLASEARLAHHVADALPTFCARRKEEAERKVKEEEAGEESVKRLRLEEAVAA